MDMPDQLEIVSNHTAEQLKLPGSLCTGSSSMFEPIDEVVHILDYGPPIDHHRDITFRT